MVWKQVSGYKCPDNSSLGNRWYSSVEIDSEIDAEIDVEIDMKIGLWKLI